MRSWVSQELFQYGSDQMINLNRPDIRFPTSAPVGNLKFTNKPEPKRIESYPTSGDFIFHQSGIVKIFLKLPINLRNTEQPA
jgi:hypothetical protein